MVGVDAHIGLALVIERARFFPFNNHHRATENCAKMMYCLPASRSIQACRANINSNEVCGKTTYHEPVTMLNNILTTLNTKYCSEMTDCRLASTISRTLSAPETAPRQCIAIRNCFETTYRRPATKGLKPFTYKSTISLPAEPMSTAMIDWCVLHSIYADFSKVHGLKSRRFRNQSYFGQTVDDIWVLSIHCTLVKIALRRHIIIRQPGIASQHSQHPKLLPDNGSPSGEHGEQYLPTTDLFLWSELCRRLACVVAPEPQYEPFSRLLTRKLEGISCRAQILDRRCGDGNETQQLAKEDFKCTASFEQTTRLIEGPDSGVDPISMTLLVPV
ncbi:hypothetical protein IW261DRAFT_1428947 [Armillaria novae-zelandiae]|uniref:Uncharacterized protein n=1 Tax=Armillaria novae-zelandiae TaxID=153914 RepID=A0AA39N7E0_9AGAR|nr:hypothetical protein IW261DRAFT_1428939 [Armillaria novae-zelandiae]KAK0460372.1 hypothetical protein IW261DRAFT_1428943 [Armillaria novae-zelandiae]KAK0460376.1 hypothetical protein IW261DRAFT_1428947 [Armillaria novae-zelandiae]